MAEKIRYEIKKKRMTDKFQPPPEGFVRIFMGDDAWPRLMRFEEGKRKKGQVHDGRHFCIVFHLLKKRRVTAPAFNSGL